MNTAIVNEVRDYILFRARNGIEDTPPDVIFKEFNKRYPTKDLLEEIIAGYEAAAESLEAEAKALLRYRASRGA